MLKRQEERMHPDFFSHQTMNSLVIGIDAEHYLHKAEYKTHRIHCGLAGSLSRSHCYLLDKKMNVLGLAKNNNKRWKEPNIEPCQNLPFTSVLSLSKQSYWGQILCSVLITPQIQVMGPTIMHPWIWCSYPAPTRWRSEKKDPKHS